jgi:synaptobrevin family protein YKT6
LSSAQKKVKLILIWKVDETEIILHDNLKKLLERQGDLDQMVAKSNDLSKSAKAFYKTSKSANSSCCVIFWKFVLCL